MISAFYKYYFDKPTMTSLAIDIVPLMASPTTKQVASK